VLKLFRHQRYAEAEQRLRQLILEFPDWPMHHYTLAAVLARQDKTKEALDNLKLALSKGFTSRQAIAKNPVFNTLRGLPRFQSLLDGMPLKSQSPLQGAQKRDGRLVEDGIALVDEINTVWESNSETLVSAFSFPDRPVSDRVRSGDDAISRRLNLLYGRRKAAGNYGDLYDNRDNGHSRLPRKAYPQLSHVTYSAEAIAARMHYGVNAHQLFNAITIGNSSTALTSGPHWRSQARLIQTTPLLMARAFQHYANDHLYVFPEHADHDPGKGDLFPANTPYMLVSQGSSGSDQPILDALAAIMAAFDPSVKTFLRSRHLVMPTAQMIFRSSLKPLTSDDEYLTGKAHPSVFDGIDLDVRKMIFRANSLRKEEVPPRVDIKVVEESLPIPGISYFGPNAHDEALFNTPSAIARVIRSTSLEKRMVIDASGTVDPNGHPLRFDWKVLRGDEELVEITKLKKDGSRVELKVKWHQRQPVSFKPQLMSSRVDVAVFAHNGFNYSAPAFVSLTYPTRQRRVYDRTGRIVEIVYGSEETRNLYQDPVLFPRRGWRDLYAYTKDDKFIGWDRITPNRIENYTRDGARVMEKDELGRAVKAERVVYRLKPGVREVIAVPSGEVIEYRYKDSEDRIGISSVVTRD
ncbi:MAG: hypothetical protein ABJJ72_15860, partial [Anderseniella sp.]